MRSKKKVKIEDSQSPATGYWARCVLSVLSRGIMKAPQPSLIVAGLEMGIDDAEADAACLTALQTFLLD